MSQQGPVFHSQRLQHLRAVWATRTTEESGFGVCGLPCDGCWARRSVWAPQVGGQLASAVHKLSACAWEDSPHRAGRSSCFKQGTLITSVLPSLAALTCLALNLLLPQHLFGRAVELTYTRQTRPRENDVSALNPVKANGDCMKSRDSEQVNNYQPRKSLISTLSLLLKLSQ